MDNITVMIVDDERMAVDDLLHITDWGAQGFEVIATAVNGKQALLKYHEFHPQVIFTDIKMPFMDGIELIQQIRKIDNKVKLLLLTAYQDFSYAQSAIRYGSVDYLIKSEITEERINKTLASLRAVISSEENTQQVVEQRMIIDFFAAELTDTDTAGQTLFSTPFQYLIIEQDKPLAISGDEEPEENRFSGAERICSSLDWENPALKLRSVCNVRRDRCLLVLQCKDRSQQKTLQLLHMMAQKLQRLLAAQTDATFTVYIVEQEMDIRQLRQCWIENRQSFRAKYLLGAGMVHHFPLQLPPPSQHKVYCEEDAVFAMVAQMEHTALPAYIQKLFEEVQRSMDDTALYYVSRNLYDVLRRSVRALPGHTHKPDISAAQNRHRWYSCADIAQWFVEKFDELLQAAAAAQQCGYSKTTVLTMDIIRAQFSRSDLTVQQLAQSVHLSVGHLCALFKKETGKTVRDYITEVRIAEAMRQLRESQQKIYEISESVGYRSSQYFSQVFYKQTGCYPADYQRGRTHARDGR